MAVLTEGETHNLTITSFFFLFFLEMRIKIYSHFKIDYDICFLEYKFLYKHARYNILPAVEFIMKKVYFLVLFLALLKIYIMSNIIKTLCDKFIKIP